MSSQCVLCIYKPKVGREAELEAKLAEHISVLSDEALLGSNLHVVMKSRHDGHYIELFEWKDESAAGMAHSNPAVSRIWGEISECADTLTMADLSETGQQFPHFDRVGV